jgi:AcrR family transcriptional regulator
MSPRRAAALRTEDGEQAGTLRDHLVASVDELLGQAPIAGLTTRAIAHPAGVADGVLYNHFDDKTQLLIAALLVRFGRLIERLEATQLTAGEGSVVANVQAFGRAMAETNAEALLIGAGLVADPPLLHRFWAEIHRTPFGIERLRRPLREYLAAEQSLGRVEADVDVEAVVTLVFGACALAGLSSHLGQTGHQPAAAAHLDAVLATALRGVAAPS